MKRILVGAGFLLGLLTAAFLFARFSYAAPVKKEKTYEGVITQINLGDGSVVIRMRDGSFLNVLSPYSVNSFVSIRGTLDDSGSLKVSSLSLKDPEGKDAIPYIASLAPGSGQVGTKIIVTGSGFLKKNSIAIGDVKNAVLNIPSRDGKTLVFTLPAAPCNQLLKVSCPRSVLPTATYNLTVTNLNGLSNSIQFQVTPLPPLTIQTYTLPQAVTGSRYDAAVEAIGGAESYIWRIASGTLPPGITFAQSACKDTPCKSPAVLRGIPTVPGTYQFTVSLTSRDESMSRDFAITVVQAVSSY